MLYSMLMECLVTGAYLLLAQSDTGIDWTRVAGEEFSFEFVGPTMLVKALSPLMRPMGRRKITIDDEGEQLAAIPPTDRARLS